MDGTTTEVAPRLPIRAAWAWPLATAGLGAAQAWTSHDQQGGSVIAVVWAVVTAFALGAWLGLLSAGLAFVLGRTPVVVGIARGVGARLPAASVIATAVVAAGLTLLAAWWGIDVVYGLVRAHPLDYDAVGRQIWRGAAGLSLTASAAALFVGLWALERRLRDRPALARRVAVVVATLVVVSVAGHLSSGPFFVYFGAPAAIAILVASTGVAAAWLPAARPVTRRAALGWGVPWLGLVLVGFVGLHDVGVRALLLHDAPMFREVHALTTGWADGDADGDLPPWLGGRDCADDDPAISGAAKEIPGNGIDDNCRGGDAALPPDPPGLPSQPPRHPTIVLVTIDSVRADHLDVHGFERATMPALARLGDSGVVFERAYAPANHTFFSVTAMLAGQSTERMLVPGEAAVPQLSYTRWLPHQLGKLGYHRVAVDPPLLLDGKLRVEDLYFDEVDVGPFDYPGGNRGVKARQVADSAIGWLERWEGDAPVFMWVHFIDPHAVHESPQRFEVRGETDAYHNELSWVDLHLGRVLDAVERKFRGQAHVIVTSDHGEQLGDAGGWGHGFSLRDVEVRVPLVLAGPEIVRQRIPGPVSTLRVPATVMHLLGFDPRMWPETPSLLVDDVDATPVVVENPAFLWNERRMEAALVEMPYKLVHSRTTNTTLLFDLERDPAERDNLAGRDPQLRDRLLEQLLDLLERGA